MRQHLPWLVALPVMGAGSFAAHSLGLLIGPAEHGHAAREAGAHAGVLPPLSGLLLALLLVWAGRRLRRSPNRGIGAAWFFLLPLLGWSLQEGFERAVGAESAPFAVAVEPRFLLGLLLQLPFALLAYLVARALLTVARRLFARHGPSRAETRARAATCCRPQFDCELPRIGSLAFGRSGRGPPLLAS